MTIPRASKPGSQEPLPIGWLVLRTLWIAVQLTLVYLLAQEGELFFYQGF